MTDPRYPRLLARSFARKPRRESVPIPPGSSADDIAVIEHALDRKSTRRRAARIAMWGGAAVMTLAAVVGQRSYAARETATTRPSAPEREPLSFVASSSGSDSVVLSSGAAVPLAGDTSLAPGSRLVVGPAAGANLALSTGTHLAIDPGSDVAVVGHGRAAVFALDRGSLRADVAKLAADEQFVVRTVDSEVEVRGTSFRVSVVAPDSACGDGTTTRVTVFEGTVVVRSNGHQDSVHVGEQWPRGCAPAIAAAQVVAADSREAPRAEVASEPRIETNVEARVEPNRTSRAPRADLSTLAEQNDQFAQAMTIKRGGNASAAIAAFERFVSAHPSSHLAENATVERMKLLATMDRAAAISAAKQYLARYPFGFARDDARAILASAR